MKVSFGGENFLSGGSRLELSKGGEKYAQDQVVHGYGHGHRRGSPGGLWQFCTADRRRLPLLPEHEDVDHGRPGPDCGEHVPALVRVQLPVLLRRVLRLQEGVAPSDRDSFGSVRTNRGRHGTEGACKVLEVRRSQGQVELT